MQSPIFNTRADIDALEGTPAHAEVMRRLGGSLWRLEKDDIAKTWRAVEDDSTVAAFGFTRADFPRAAPPALPAYVPPASTAPQVVSMRQARLALLQAGLLEQVNAAVATMPGIEGETARVEWEYAQEVRREQALVQALAAVLDLSSEALEDLFIQAAKL